MEKFRKFSVPYRVAQTASKINQSLTKALKDYDIASEQRVILDLIDQDSSISQNELSQALGKDKTTISRTLDAIEKKGYILREQTRDDKRFKIISLTVSGKKVLEETKPIIESLRSYFISDFSEDEVETINRLLNKISLNIDRFNNEK
ncbi:MarR family winged helix-turn-helix transcriptional regulator [Halarcobacter anaerophilus]|jgi:DNA-binding MarR family transcriptional regulator|uniref:MarR family winged helix-turn-helix transcriptional regulator n=1 Tax=Halarcobacter anaerophilus TaxID=877500 RepID=UPI0005C9E517|nr:MarR family transcriptional regulator [Halarcobacter anaerophilus]